MSEVFERRKNNHYIRDSPFCGSKNDDILQTGEGIDYGIRYKHNTFDKSLFPPIKLSNEDMKNILSYLGQMFDIVSVSSGRLKWNFFVKDEKFSGPSQIYFGQNGQDTEIKVKGEVCHRLYEDEKILLDTVMRSPVIGEKLMEIFKEGKYEPGKTPREILEDITPYARIR